MDRGGVPDDVAEHDAEHLIEGLVTAVVDGLLIGVGSTPSAELLAIFDQCLDDHGQVLDARFGHWVPLLDLLVADDMFGVVAEHGRDVDEVPCS